jgi:hypothetical protein
VGLNLALLSRRVTKSCGAHAYFFVPLFSPRDIAFVPSKVRTGLYKTAADMPAELNAYIMEHNHLDLQLWELANKKLDDHISRIEAECGEGHFAQALAKYKEAQALVEAECSNYREWYSEHGFPR